MIYGVDKKDMNKIAHIFDGWEETLLWSCLQGYMGNAYTNSIEELISAQIIIGDFCFFAGIPDTELVRNIPNYFSSDCILMIPENKEWETLIEEEYKDKANKFMRYAIKKDPNIFNRDKLSGNIKRLSYEYSIKRIDEEIYNKIKNTKSLNDLCAQFSTYSDFEKYGIGFVILHDKNPIAGASSYTVYDKGIEIEIDTLKDCRRQGLALVCASKLILECLDREIYPSWDAANKASLALAEKLGYQFDREYVTYEITNFR